MSTIDRLGLEHRLATYGTLAPERLNAHLLEGLAGTWTRGTISGYLHERGWGAEDGYPGIVLDDSGPQVEVQVFSSRDLPAHWQRLDDFEGPGYRRVPVSVGIDRDEVAAYVYALADDSAGGPPSLNCDQARQVYTEPAERGVAPRRTFWRRHYFLVC